LVVKLEQDGVIKNFQGEIASSQGRGEKNSGDGGK